MKQVSVPWQQAEDQVSGISDKDSHCPLLFSPLESCRQEGEACLLGRNLQVKVPPLPSVSLPRGTGWFCPSLGLGLPQGNNEEVAFSDLSLKFFLSLTPYHYNPRQHLSETPMASHGQKSLKVALFVRLTKCPFQPISSIPRNNSSGIDKRHSSDSQAQLSCHTEWMYFKIFSDKKMFQVGTFKLAGKSREFTIRSSLKDLYSPLLFQRNSLDIINSF